MHSVSADKRGSVYSNGVFSECVLCFAYITGIDHHFVQIQICCTKLITL